jgi:hypothetical protein
MPHLEFSIVRPRFTWLKLGPEYHYIEGFPPDALPWDSEGMPTTHVFAIHLLFTSLVLLIKTSIPTA